MPLRRSSFLLTSLLLASANLATANDNWVEVNSPHFSVATDAGDKRGREVAERFEQMRAVFGALILKDKVNIPVPLQIIGFRSTKEMRQFSPLWHGKPIELAGLFQQAPDRNFILLDLSSEDPYETTFHEYAHLLLNGSYPPTAPWFDEGFAEYYSSIRVVGKDVEIGRPPEGDVDVLLQNRFMPVLMLFAVTQDSAVYNESGDHRSMFYAESWLLVHYLFDKKLLGKTGKYFSLVHEDHVPIAQAIQTAFGMDASHLDHALADYWGRKSVSMTTVGAPAFDSEKYPAKQLAPADAHAILADAHFHNADYQQKAVSEFEEVLKEDPSNESAERGLGYAYLYRHNFANASAHFRRAIELNSQDPRVLYYSAVCEVQRAGGASPGDLPQLRQQLEKAIALDPSFADAYGLLGYVELRMGKPQDALNTLAAALQSKPRDEHLLLNYGNALASLQKLDQAAAIFTQLKDSPEPSVASQAQSGLEQISRLKLVVAHGGRIVPSTADAEEVELRDEPETEAAPVKVDARPIAFLKGRLISTDCSAKPKAILTVRSGQKLWKMHTTDTAHLVLMGADSFSCAWKDRAVAINYRENSDGDGDLVSMELEQP